MRSAQCHTDKPYHAKNLCKNCYVKKAHNKRMQSAEWRAKQNLKSRLWAIANPERVYILDANKHLLKKYGITLEQYKVILASQNGVRAVCKFPEKIASKKRISRLAVDHDHNTGKIRGLLCFKCNTSISILENNPERLYIISEYLGVKNAT